MKVRAEINKMETQRTIQRTNDIRSCFFEKISKMAKSLVKLTRIKRKKTLINEIRDEKGNITINTNELHRVTREY
jgi:hypothetical protein